MLRLKYCTTATNIFLCVNKIKESVTSPDKWWSKHVLHFRDGRIIGYHHGTRANTLNDRPTACMSEQEFHLFVFVLAGYTFEKMWSRKTLFIVHTGACSEHEASPRFNTAAIKKKTSIMVLDGCKNRIITHAAHRWLILAVKQCAW